MMKNYFSEKLLKFSRFNFLLIGILMLFSGTLIASDDKDQLADLDKNSNLALQEIVVAVGAQRHHQAVERKLLHLGDTRLRHDG